MGIYRMSEKKVVIIRVSAWRTAVSRPFASQSHWAIAGEEQIAQSGSIVSGFSRSRYGSRSLESRVNEMVTGKTWRKCRWIGVMNVKVGNAGISRAGDGGKARLE